jgi:hypothetical protein
MAHGKCIRILTPTQAEELKNGGNIVPRVGRSGDYVTREQARRACNGAPAGDFDGGNYAPVAMWATMPDGSMSRWHIVFLESSTLRPVHSSNSIGERFTSGVQLIPGSVQGRSGQFNCTVGKMPRRHMKTLSTTNPIMRIESNVWTLR